MSSRASRQLGLIAVVASAAALLEAHGYGMPSGQDKSGPRYTFADGRVSFAAPPGFTPLTAEELAQKFPAGSGPRQAVGNARRTTTIAYDLLNQRAPSTDLEAARKTFAGIYERAFPALKWVAREVRRLGDREWAYLEFTAPAADQEIHNIVMVSIYDGRVLMFNFNSTVKEFPSVERALRASIATIAASP